MFTKKENYNKLLEVKELGIVDNSFTGTISWFVKEFDNTEDYFQNSVVFVEVWEDSDNAIKIQESSEEGTQFLNDKLPENVKEHLFKLVYRALLDL